MHEISYIKKWKKWAPRSFCKNRNFNNILKKKNKNINDNNVSKEKMLFNIKEIYNEGFLKGKKIGHKIEHKKFYIYKKKKKLEIKKIKSLFLSLKKSIKSIDSYMSIKIVKIFFNIIKRNSKIFNNISTKKLIKDVKKYLYKECSFLHNLTFKFNPIDLKLIKKKFIKFFKFKNWILISDKNVSKGECQIISPEININFTNTDNWNNLYRIFLLEKNS
ncbi:MAG: hypothetical protein BucCj_0510 [Buchnera aphidicola (Ceratovacuna japonica)]